MLVGEFNAVFQTAGLLVFSTVQQHCLVHQKEGDCDSRNIRARQWREMCCGRKSFFQCQNNYFVMPNLFMKSDYNFCWINEQIVTECSTLEIIRKMQYNDEQ